MKKAVKVIVYTVLILSISILVYNSNDRNSNQTSVGSFWYHGCDCELGCNLKSSSYHNKFMYNDKLLIHIVILRSDDKPIYHYGTAIMEKDTLKLKVEEKDKFSYRWDNEIKRTMCLSPANLYFTSEIIPKHITVQFDSYGPIPLDSLKIRNIDGMPI